jgi:hypothetical protein
MTDIIVRPNAGLDEVLTLGKTLAASGYFNDTRDAAQAAVKVLAGQELGLGPIASMTGIYIVKGRVTMSANLMAAQIKRSGRYNYRVTTMTNDAVVVEFYEGGQSIGVSSYTADDAKAAGLWGSSDPWKKSPRNMLFARAMSNGAKWFTPDIFAGPVYTPDEMESEGPMLPPAPPVNVLTGEVVEQDERQVLIAELRGLYREAKSAGVSDLPTKEQIAASTVEQLRAIADTLREMIHAVQLDQSVA